MQKRLSSSVLGISDRIRRPWPAAMSVEPRATDDDHDARGIVGRARVARRRAADGRTLYPRRSCRPACGRPGRTPEGTQAGRGAQRRWTGRCRPGKACSQWRRAVLVGPPERAGSQVHLAGPGWARDDKGVTRNVVGHRRLPGRQQDRHCLGRRVHAAAASHAMVSGSVTAGDVHPHAWTSARTVVSVATQLCPPSIATGTSSDARAMTTSPYPACSAFRALVV